VSFSVEDIKRMGWHSRRGMLELDLILVPFAERHLPGLSESELKLYQELLQEEDQDLFVWFTQREAAPTSGLRQIIELVLGSRTPR
jgi:antitoxin CptB